MSRSAAIFDLDGTLLAPGSAERLFLARAFRDRMVRPVHLVRGAGLGLGAWLRRRASLMVAAKHYLSGLECAPLEALGVQVVHEDVVPRLRPALLDELESHRARGREIVLLSGTLDFLGTEVAKSIGADAVALARLERRDGRFTGRVLEPYPHGEGKVRALEDLARTLGLDLAGSHAYANHASDAAHLERVGHPHAVTPDRGLRRVALERHWSVHDDADSNRGAQRARPHG